MRPSPSHPAHLRFSYRLFLLVTAFSVRIDVGDAHLLAMGLWDTLLRPSFMNAVLRRVTSLTVWSTTALASLEDFLLRLRLARGSDPQQGAVLGASSLFTLSRLNLPAPQLPWLSSVTFDHLMSLGDDLSPAALFLHDLGERWVPKQYESPCLSLTILGRYRKGIGSWLGAEDTAATPVRTDELVASLAHFLATVRFPDHLLIVSDGSLSLRLLSQRFDLAGLSSAASSTTEVSFLREHILRLLWRYPLISFAIGRALSSSEALDLIQKLGAAYLPTTRADISALLPLVERELSARAGQLSTIVGDKSLSAGQVVFF